MGNAVSNSEERQLLRPNENEERIQKYSILYDKSHTGRIIELGGKSPHLHSAASYHFMAVYDGVIFVPSSCRGIVHRYCINSGRQLDDVQSKSISTELRGIATLKNRKATSRAIIIIGDHGRQCLVAIDVDVNGNVAQELSFATLVECCGLATNGCDKIYATDWAKHTISVFKESSGDSEGFDFRLIKTISHAKLQNPYCMTIHQRLLIVGQPMNGSVLIFSDKGNLLKEVSHKALLGKESPRGICTDRCGNIVIANGLGNNVLVIDTNGNVVITLQNSNIVHAKCIRDIKIYEKQIILLASLNEKSFDEEVLILL